MRILYFTRDYNTHDHRFLEALVEYECEIGFLSLERGERQLEKRPLPAKVKKIHWAGGIPNPGWLDIPKLLISLRKVLRDFNPDLVQAGPVQRSAFLTALSGFHPLVTMSWGYDLLVDVHKGAGWEWATRYTLKHSDSFVGDCNVIRNLAEHYGMESDRIVTFPWGADIDRFSPVKNKSQTNLRKHLGWDNKTFVIVSNRGWSEIYGTMDLANAFVTAIKQKPGLRLLMLGSGPLAHQIHNIFSQAGVSEYVNFPGQVSQDNLVEYYQSADLYVSTSHSDGTSISLLEALSSGTPVLVTNIPGNKEWITKSGDVGWLFQDGNVQDLVQGILHAYDNRQELPGMARTARKLAVKKANWHKNFPILFEAYQIATA